MLASRSIWRLLLLPLVGSLFLACAQTPKPAPPEPPPVLPVGPAVSYESDVKPVLERRCVVCHGCYDAPCQLLLSSYEGITRGATKKPVYDSSRLEAVPPTRLFVDASSTAEWRERGFRAVVEDQMGASAHGWSSSLLQRMIALGHSHPLPANEKLPKSVFLDIQRPLQCATREEFDDYAARNPWGGMPYGMAPLSDEEFLTLERWLSQGAPGPSSAAALPPDVERRVHTLGDVFQRKLQQGATRGPVSLRAPLRRPPLLRGRDTRSLLRTRSVANGARQADRRDRHGAAL